MKRSFLGIFIISFLTFFFVPDIASAGGGVCKNETYCVSASSCTRKDSKCHCDLTRGSSPPAPEGREHQYGRCCRCLNSKAAGKEDVGGGSACEGNTSHSTCSAIAGGCVSKTLFDNNCTGIAKHICVNTSGCQWLNGCSYDCAKSD